MPFSTNCEVMQTSSIAVETNETLLNPLNESNTIQQNKYSSWDKSRLIAHIQSLEQQQPVRALQQRRKVKPFDFAKHRARHIALKISYIGDKYYGFASASNDSVPTVESYIFKALEVARLIPSDGGACAWSRCGRTDKGVSAFDQVVSVWVRTARPGDRDTLDWDQVAKLTELMKKGEVTALSSCLTAAPTPASDLSSIFSSTLEQKDTLMQDATQATKDQSSHTLPNELPYLNILNRLLPDDIRVLAWSPVDPIFDARFTCSHRKYNYFFDGAGLDLIAMRDAASRFVGTHDCRHICKIDPTKAAREGFFVRTIMECDIVPVRQVCGDSFEMARNTAVDGAPDRFHVLIVKGRAFLWHQVRNMMALLFLIGRGMETPDMISDMLDLTKHAPAAGRPFYEMAPDGPLVLVECAYPPCLVDWRVLDSDSCGGSHTLQVSSIATANEPAFPAKALESAKKPGVRNKPKESPNDIRVISQLSELWRSASIKELQLRTLVNQFVQLGSCSPKFADQYMGVGGGHSAQRVVVGTHGKGYVKLLNRSRCDSIEDLLKKQEDTRHAVASAIESGSTTPISKRKARLSIKRVRTQ
ncbi:pseudouridine synthase deg1 [Batrachochytrium dendrobatidis]